MTLRIIGNLKVTFTGKTSQEGNFIPTRVEKVGTGEWFKVTPRAAFAARRICRRRDAEFRRD